MSGPFDGVSDKLSAGQGALIQVCGDSTAEGLRTPTTPDPSYGWVGRFGIDIGDDYDVDVEYHGAAYPGSVTWPGYNQNVTLRVSSDDSAPTLTIYNGSIGGAQATHLISWITGAQNMIPDPDPDLVLVACGFNDVINGASMLTRLQSLVTTIRARCPSAPIVVTTENRSAGTYPTSFFLSSFSAVSNYYVGAPLNLSPPLIESGVADNVWMMDTQQAWTAVPLTDWLTTGDGAGGLHPNSTGYQAQADWMYGLFPSPIPRVTTTTLDALIRSVAFSQVLTATREGVTWSVSAGTLPLGITLDADTGELSGTPLSYGGSYDFTVRATGTAGYGEQRFTGAISRNTDPFTPSGPVRVVLKQLGLYYPVAQRIKAGGPFITVLPRT